MGQINFNTYNVILVFFPAYAGGKFVSNCLSLSDNVLPQDINYACELIDDSTPERRLEIIKSTLPPASDMLKWREYELGDHRLYGTIFRLYGTIFNEKHPYDKAAVYPAMSKVIDSQKYFFFMGHFHLDTILALWPNAKILVLENFKEFQKLAVSVKKTKKFYHQLLDKDAIYIDLLKEQGRINTVDMSKIFEFDEWVIEINRLYDVFALDDFNKELLYSYWKDYMALHV